MKQPNTRFDRLNGQIKNNPVVAVLLILGTIVIALSTFTNAAKNLWTLRGPDTRPDINGDWAADVTYDWANAGYSEIFTFGGEGEQLQGTASLRGRKRGILEGTVKGDRLQFSSKTQEVLGDWNNPRDVLHRYQGRILHDEITFVMQTEGGLSPHVPVEFTAKKVIAAASK